MIIGDCGIGLVKLCIARESLSALPAHTELLRALGDLAALVAGHGGVAVVESAAPELKAQLQVWGAPPQSFAVLAGLKRTFDPEGVLNPGRFIGGL
jgi:glycolate oxidase FAD binding subunit